MTAAPENVSMRWAGAVPAALAACAGAVDLLALAGLGGAFAGVITGNLVTAGYGIGTGDVELIAPTSVAVAGFTLGVLAWARLWRGRPRALVGPLLAELVLLIVVAAGWAATRAHPGTAVSLALLALAAIAMGGQSVAALRLQASTTYMTGTLVTVLQDVVTGRAGRRRQALRQLIALVAGAAAAAALLHTLPWAVPLLPIVLLTASVGLVAANRTSD
ncbi:DUF1275 family protein [Pseudonocardia sp.]|jgi:uncharacterized membrane protein YoaK (UPF0700 family)|uniref:DUF1275 family protein n=1 Tax=Pseudonocardia sp. TaxID=60912 RepID=UPI002D830513|nr:DUF1275 family protein [Pseudonocardia sp.]